MAINDNLVRGENFIKYANHILSYYDKPYSDIGSVKDGDIIYCDTRSIYNYRDILMSKKELVIITHNCIGHVKDNTPRSRKEDVNLDDFEGCYRLWFAKNSFSKKENVHPIPLGFENKRWDKYGVKENTFNNIKQKDPTKNLYLNCKIGTNVKIRQECWDKCKNIQVDMEGPNRPFNLFMKKMLDYRFIISPDGAGVDCHRTYESFFLKRIPIIREEYPLKRLYGDMPVIYVNNDWLNLKNIDFEKVYDMMKGQFNPHFLTQEYWRIKMEKLINV